MSSNPSMVGKNRMHELTARYSTRPSAPGSPNTTVQAPQSPSAQPSLVPVRRISSRKYSSTVVVHGTFSAHTNCPSSRKRTQSKSSSPVNRVTPGSYQQRHVIMLLGMGDTDADQSLVNESGL